MADGFKMKSLAACAAALPIYRPRMTCISSSVATFRVTVRAQPITGTLGVQDGYIPGMGNLIHGGPVFLCVCAGFLDNFSISNYKSLLPQL